MENNQNNKIRFSVLIPVYNTERFLDGSIGSVLSQTYQNFEIILVNDGSKDHSGEICDQYAAQYENVHAYHKENGGQLHTRQYAISKASGEYCVFLDSDDALRPWSLELLDKKIRQYDCDCVIFQFERVRDGKVLAPAPKVEDQLIENKKQLYEKCLSEYIYNSMCTKAVKMDILEKNADYTGYYHMRHGEDLIQSMEVLRNSSRVLFIGDALYEYTSNPDSVTNTWYYENYHIDFSARIFIFEQLKKEQIWDQESMARYTDYCIKLFCGELHRNCGFNVSIRKKLKRLNEFRQDIYYQKYLSHHKPNPKRLGRWSLLYKLFCMGLDIGVYAVSAAYTQLNTRKRK